MKALGVLVMMALVVGAFTSIPNVSAIGEYGDSQFTKAKGTGHLTFGSASGKVCGIELCGSKSMPVAKVVEVKTVTSSSMSASERALEKALQGAETSQIVSAYNEFRGVEVVEIEEETLIVSNFNAFANPEFYNPSDVKTTEMKAQPEMTLNELKAEQVREFKEAFPSYLRETYANPDHPIYVPKVNEMIIENATSSEVVANSNMTDADTILFDLGFDIDVSKIGICGPGTELINGICLINGEVPDTVNTDWADYWDTKEDKEVVLEQIIMTNGTQAIPVDNTMQVPAPGFEDVDEMVVEDGSGSVEPSADEAPVVIPSFEESTLGSNSTSIDIESIPVPEILEEVVDTTVVVDDKTFKDQASADRYLKLTGKTVEETPVIEDGGFDNSGLTEVEP